MHRDHTNTKELHTYTDKEGFLHDLLQTGYTSRVRLFLASLRDEWFVEPSTLVFSRCTP